MNIFCEHRFVQLLVRNVCIVILSILFVRPFSVAQCPVNIDFEQGNFNGWTCYTGNVLYIGGVNKINLTAVPGPVPGRHEMLSAVPGNGPDPYGNFPQNCPNGSNHSIKLGNNLGGAQAEGVSYTFTIPPGQDQFSLIYHYAVVFQDPGHLAAQQPRMEIEILNLTDNVTLGCSSFSFIASSGLPGFFLSPNPGSPTPVWCKDWSANSINLNGNAGKTIRLFFKTADCTFSAHFGYAYIDVNSECSSLFTGATFCPDDTAINVIAPYGYQAYKWFNGNFTQVLGNQQVLHLAPPPPSGSLIKVELTPYSGYGCLDTLTANLFDTLTVHAYAGNDTVLCPNNPVQLGALPEPNLVYSWSPVTGLSDPNIANPVATVGTSTRYILSVTHDGGGCLTKDTVDVNIIQYDTTLSLAGPASHCSGTGQSVVLTVHAADSIQWYLNGIAIPGANQVNYTVSQTGDYSAVLFSFVGCIFATGVQHIDIYQSPVAGFNVNIPLQCFNGNQFIFSNTTPPNSGPLSYYWSFGDGTSDTAINPSHAYRATGTYLVKMKVKGDGGCEDSTSVNVKVDASPLAGFRVNTPSQCFKNNLFVFSDTSSVSSGSLTYSWDFGDGSPLQTTRNPSHVYLSPGTFSVRLTVTATGTACTDSKTFDLQIYPSPVVSFTANALNQCFPGHQFVFTNGSTIQSGAMFYTWRMGDGTIQTGTNATYSYTKPGAYTVWLIAATVNGCQDSSRANINVYPMPTADFTITPVCTYLPVPLKDNTYNNTSSNINYLWDFGDGRTSNLRSPSFSYALPGTYNITLSVSTIQCPLPLSTIQRSVVVDLPVPGITYPQKDAVMNFPEPLKARQFGNNITWFPGTYLDNRNSYTPTFRGLNPQLYTIQIRASNGCLTVDTQMVKTHKKIDIYVPTAFSPGNNGLNNYLRPILLGFDRVNYFRIFDRWGKMLFEMKSDRPGWDGKINNVSQEIQTVVWMIEAVDIDGVTHHRQGTTVLMR